MNNIDTIQELEGESLSEVAFIMDYIQFGFADATVTVYSKPLAELEGNRYLFPAAGSRDALCAFIGHTVIRVVVKAEESIVLMFDNGLIGIPIDAAKRVNGDGVEFWPKKGGPPIDY